jgi:hypothetical protein
MTIRKCDGSDPNLTRPLREGESQQGPWLGQASCDCGSEFDDATWMVVWPHQEVRGTRTLVGGGVTDA